MRLIRLPALVVAIALVTPCVASAQSLGQLDWVGTGSSFTATFTRYNGQTVTGYAGAAYRANAALPTSAPWYLQPGNGFGPALDIFCIDFLHAAWTTTYPAYFTNLAYDNLTRTRSTNLGLYQRVAWLTNQMDAQTFSNNDRQDRVDIHAAIWRILSGEPRSGTFAGSISGASTSRVTNWINLANNNFASVDLSDYVVVTAACVYNSGQAGDGHSYVANPQCGQEFLVRADTTPTVPEPETIILLATGLIALAAMAYARGGLA
jgi:hypothetical protein